MRTKQGGSSLRVAVGGYLVACNTFATQPFTLEHFQRGTIPGDTLLKVSRGGESAISGFLDGVEEKGWEVVPLPFVVPGILGTITKEAHEWAKDQILSALRKAGRVDGVFLQLHGTAVAEHLDDCDGDLLAAIRGVIGDNAPLFASLDGHSNTTPFMVQQATMLIGVKTNPHYDFAPVGRQAARVMTGMVEERVKPTAAWAQPARLLAPETPAIAPGWPMEHCMRWRRKSRCTRCTRA
jgi:microcystin degradation protein MlrC